MTTRDIPIITHVAIIYNDVVYSLPKPNRHHNVIRLIGGISGPHKEGFLDENMKFYNRKDAMLLAVSNGQLNRKQGAEFYQGPELFSEDLW